MKKYYLRPIVLLTFLALCFVGVGVCMILKLYWVVIVLFLAGFYFGHQLYMFLVRANVDVERLVGAISVGEFGLSFELSTRKGLYPEVGEKMKDAVAVLGERMKDLKTEQSFYDILLSRIDTPILLFNGKYEIVWINKAATNTFGISNPQTLIDLDNTSTEVSDHLKSLKPREVKTIKISKCGKEVTLAATASILTLHGKAQTLVSLKDIQKTLEENESEAWKKLIRILTHEMMNSLTPIISLAETFSDKNLEHEPEMMNKAIQTIFRRSKGLVEFVNNYQQLTRIPQPQKELLSAKTLIASISQLLKGDNILFSYHISPADLEIYADCVQLEQVLINLLKNAWEATSMDEQARVEVGVEMNSYQQTILTVSDNGSGILPSVSENIFVPFYTTKQEGSGIGLSICRQIINNHGGTIIVHSKEGEGTQFVISL